MKAAAHVIGVERATALIMRRWVAVGDPEGRG